MKSIPKSSTILELISWPTIHWNRPTFALDFIEAKCDTLNYDTHNM
eukprot:UN07738